MGVDFPRLKINKTPFISSLYHFKTAQKKLDDSDVGNTFEIQVSEIPVLITKGQEYDCAREIRKMPKKSAQMYGYGFKQFIYTWHGEMNSIDQKLFL